MATRRPPNEELGFSLEFWKLGNMHPGRRCLPTRLKAKAAILVLSSFLFGCSREEPPVQSNAPSSAPSAPALPAGKPLSAFGGGACEVASMSGFYPAENWGSWTEKDPAEILLKSELKGSVNVKFTGYTFDDGTPHKLTISIGNTSKTITLTSEPKAYDLSYSLSAPAKSVILTGFPPRAHPTDKRLMGAGFISVECTPK